jgi:cysteinyl-tRNA synthetase
MSIRIYNSLTRGKEDFLPLKGKKVRFYSCGVTVYDDCHIGHARSLYTFEVIRRYLKYRGFQVKFIRNITDIDDKIINRANELGINWEELIKKYIARYNQDLKALDIPKADLEPRATENIPEMIKHIKGLIKKGYAYPTKSGVYFSVRKFKDYGKLSGQGIDDMRNSVRINAEEDKQDPLDFALWKEAKDGEPSWKSPWGQGRPGWHIECSVMSQKYLKTKTLDIHGGGRDLIFPHHENEIAQSESYSGKTFAKYWIHHGLLTINNQKMSKSLGNFVTVQDILKKYSPDVLKLLFLQAHYSSPVDFSWEKMEEMKTAYQRIIILISKIKTVRHKSRDKNISVYQQQFIEAMDDNFNTSKALAALFDLVSKCNKLIDGSDKTDVLGYGLSLIKEMADTLGLSFTQRSLKEISVSKIDEKIKLRLEYRKQKNFSQSDRIRKELEEKGIILEDTKNGTTWRRRI